ncbi:MAG: L,D-transpeptidase family protein [Hyphomicrobiales bacterium]|nr:L,D-transpeptidase family protein [Hyphomicrobiales bacterium]MDE2116122.1 L,D-transpeptidase family protein [Hyphomicrobiales bacterium]
MKLASKSHLVSALTIAFLGLAASPTLAQSIIQPLPAQIVPAPAVPSRNLLPAPAPAATAPNIISVPTGTGVVSSPLPAGPAVAGPVVAAPGATILHPVKRKPRRIVRRSGPLQTLVGEDPVPSVGPDTFFLTAKAAEKYSAIVDAGGWPRISGALGPRSSGAPVLALRRRLAIEGDLGSDSGSSKWTPDLTNAVKRFQARLGLRPTGLVNGATLREINVSAAARFNQLASTADRLAGRKFNFGERYVDVNIPSAAVEAVENGQVAHRYVAVVGAPQHQSPEISASISAINLNPNWTLPQSIIIKEIIPKMQKDPNYLTHLRIKIYDYRNHEINPRDIDWYSKSAANHIFRQDSGVGDALGQLRIQMFNKDAVYMHDTPTKQYFNSDFRFLSHGCVRVQGVNDLAAWLLHGTGSYGMNEWDEHSLVSRIKSGARQDISLPHAVPVMWVYMTGWATADGVVHFREDAYHLDNIGGQQARADSPEILYPNR